MSNGSGVALFYQEVDDAIAKSPPDVGHLEILRDLCIAVDADARANASRLTRALVRLSGVKEPLRDISSGLYATLRARILFLGWFEEFDLLLDWEQDRFGSRASNVAWKWDAILRILEKEPQSIGFSSLFVPHLILVLDREEEWKRALNGLKGVLRHLAKVERPKTPTTATIYSPADPDKLVVARYLDPAVEQIFRLLQMLLQQMLHLAMTRLERDIGDVHVLRKVQGMQEALEAILENEKKLPLEKSERTLDKVIRVAEFRYGPAGSNQHRFLDAFPRHQSRSVVFHSLDRETRDEPDVRGEKLRNIHRARTRQLEFLLTSYGHPWDPRSTPSTWHTSWRARIKSKQGGRLGLADNGDIAAFLNTVFEHKLAELTAPGQPPLDKNNAGALAWGEAVKIYGRYFSQLTSHSRLNLTEGPPNYLTYAFPRNLGGRALHDCGVYAVRSAYTLLSVLNRINQLHQNLSGTVTPRWIRFPLHVGLMIECEEFGLLVQHNDHLIAIDNETLGGHMLAWQQKPPKYDSDPPASDARSLKFYEDISASVFSSDLDMPVLSIPVLAAGEPVTLQTIWDSYQRRVVPSQLFSGLIGSSNAPQYQFDTRYLALSEKEREWFNLDVRRFWNARCNDAWTTLTGPAVNNNPAELTKRKQPYTEELEAAVQDLLKSYRTRILPEKHKLSTDLRSDSKLLLPGIRIVEAARIGTVLPPVQRVREHIADVSRTDFKFPPGFVPAFAQREEELMEIP